MATHCTLCADPFDPEALLRDFSQLAQGAGAIASFTGIARGMSKAGDPVSGLYLEHHERLTRPSMQRICDDAARRFPVSHLFAIHRHGLVPAGDPIVMVAAASAHRRAALEAVDYTMDRLKTDAIFWKREESVDGSQWIEPTQADHAERARWDDT